jgi:tRNA-binding EMAP/Myf-like protein
LTTAPPKDDRFALAFARGTTQQVIIVANLEPRQLRGEVSQGMILAASDLKILAEGATPSGEAKPGADERDVVVLTVQKPVKPGSRVS